MTELKPIELDVDEQDESIELLFSDINNTGGTTDYNKLINKPTINGHVVEDDKVGADYELQDLMEDITAQEIDNIIYGG